VLVFSLLTLQFFLRLNVISFCTEYVYLVIYCFWSKLLLYSTTQSNRKSSSYAQRNTVCLPPVSLHHALFLWNSP